MGGGTVASGRVSSPRHVLLNALFLDPAASGGPETYLRGLAPALHAARPDTQLTIATTRADATALREDGWDAWAAIRELPCDEGQRGRRQLAEQILLPALARRARADVVHSLASVAPIRVPGIAHAITLHDVTFFRIKTFGAVTTWGMQQVVSRAARHADALIAVTAAARDEIVEELGLPEERFSVVHHGATRPTPVAPAPEQEVRERYGIKDRRVVLCVASKRPHKNQALLVRAAAELGEDVVIVLAGHPEPYDAELRALAGDLGVREKIRFADYVPDPDLEALWGIAGVAAFPTRAEGFGMPVLEALSRGVPVACSDLTVLREVSGGLARTFDPDDAPGAAAAISEALRGGGATAVEGPAWAARFTWEAAAQGTWEAYERALRCTSG
jgi:glycosyltransferase involved in cell wall biosynthesis